MQRDAEMYVTAIYSHTSPGVLKQKENLTNPKIMFCFVQK